MQSVPVECSDICFLDCFTKLACCILRYRDAISLHHCVIIYGILSISLWAFLFSMFVVLVRVISLLCLRCIFFLAFYLLATSTVLCLSLSLPLWAYLYRLELFRNDISLCPVLWAPCFTSSNLGGCLLRQRFFCSSIISSAAPLPVHCMRMHSDLKGGSIAEGFRLFTMRMRRPTCCGPRLTQS